MKHFLKHNLLPITVFISGGCVLIVEVVAVRVLSPYFGNTIFTVSSVISVILAALSIGYYVGGKLSDRYPSLRWFFGIIMLSGLSLLIFYSLSTVLLPALSSRLSLTAGPLVSSLLLFMLPALLLGTLSPYAVKLQSVRFPDQGVGSVAGNIFFWSTLGSILGSLLAGFALIPMFGIDRIFIATAIVLFLLGFVPLVTYGLSRKYLVVSVLAVLVLSLLTIGAVEARQEAVVYSKDGVYEKVTIYDDVLEGRPVRYFMQDRSNSGAMYLDTKDPTQLVYDYTRYYSVYKAFKPDVKDALVIGGGAYSIPKALLADLPEANVDVSEIEPSLHDLSTKYFQVSDDPRLRTYIEDGRRLLRDSKKNYDFIFSDVYYSLYSIPGHFTTKEFFEVAKSKTTADGVFVANLIGDLSRQQPSFIMSEIKTFRQVFPNSYFFATTDPGQSSLQNIVAVGHNSSQRINLDSAALRQHPDLLLRSLSGKQINVDRFNLSPYPVLTDNYSPVEFLTSSVLKRSSDTKTLISGEEMLAVISQQMGYGPRHMTAPGHKATQKFLTAEMEQLVDEVQTQVWDYKAKDGSTQKLTNIIGRLQPELKQRVILATHYDSKRLADRETDPSRRTLPVPGANDSASGVAVLVELAKSMSNTATKANVGIDFVFFDGEEGDEQQGSNYQDWRPLGSTYFSENLTGLYGDSKPLSAVVVDMVCKEGLRIHREQSSMRDARIQVDAFWKIATKGNSRVFIDRTVGTTLDDHTPLNSAGIPSILLIDLDYRPFHTLSDTVDKCSADSLEAVAGAVREYVYSL